MAATANQVVLDTPAADFRLPATDGKTYALDDVAGEKGTVVVFICNHCPYVKAVIDRMVADARVLMSEGVGFAAICSNDAASYPEDSFENMKRFAKAHGFPVSISSRRDPDSRTGVWGGLYAGLLRLQCRPQAQVSRPARRRPHNSASRGGAA
jgi:peroxiredoxin